MTMLDPSARIRGLLTVAALVAACAFARTARAQCADAYPVDCGDGTCCGLTCCGGGSCCDDFSYPYCCDDGTCAAFPEDCGSTSSGGGGSTSSGGGVFEGTCQAGEVPCGVAHCIPSDGVCCASIGLEQYYCQQGTRCLQDGCEFGYAYETASDVETASGAPYGPSLPRSCSASAEGDERGDGAAGFLVLAPLALAGLLRRSKRGGNTPAS